MCTMIKNRTEEHVRAKRYLGTTFKLVDVHIQAFVTFANELFGPDINRPLVIGGPTASSGYRLNIEAYDKSASHTRLKGICMQAMGIIGFYGMLGKIHLAGMNLRAWGDMCSWAQAHMGMSGYQIEHERRGAKPKVDKKDKGGDGAGPSKGKGKQAGKRAAPQGGEQEGPRRSGRLVK